MTRVRLNYAHILETKATRLSNDPFAKLLAAQQDPDKGAAAVQAAVTGGTIPSSGPIFGAHDDEAQQRSRPLIEGDPESFHEPDPTPSQWQAVPPGDPAPPFTDTSVPEEAPKSGSRPQPSQRGEPEPVTEETPEPTTEPENENPKPVSEPTPDREVPKVVLPWNSDIGIDHDLAEEFGGMYDDDDDDTIEGTVQTPRGNAMEKLSGLSPKTLFEKHPKLKKPVLIGGGVTTAALAVAFLFGGSPASENPVPKTGAPSVVEETEQPVSGQVTTIFPDAVSASCPPGSTASTLAFTPKSENAWVCGRANGTDGAVMNLMFKKPVIVKSMTIMPGWNYVAPNGTDNWNKHRLVTKVLWRLGGQQFIQNINPTRAGATLTLPGNGITTSVMSMTILQTIRPDAVQSEGMGGAPDGSLLPPNPITGGGDDEVDKSTAISSITITGAET